MFDLPPVLVQKLTELFSLIDNDGDGLLAAGDLNLLAIAVTGRAQPHESAEDELDSAKRVAANVMLSAGLDPPATDRTLSLIEFLAFSSFFSALPVEEVLTTLDFYIAVCHREKGILEKPRLQFMRMMSSAQPEL